MESIENFEVEEDLRQSEEYARFMEKIGWSVEKIKGGQIFIRSLGLVSIAKIQRTTPHNWQELESKLKLRHVMMCKLEPKEDKPEEWKGNRFRQDEWPLLETRTLRVDLRPNEDDILSGFSKEARYTLRKRGEYELECKTGNYELLYKILRESTKRKKLWMAGWKEFNDLTESFSKKCWGVTVGNLAGALILTHQNVAYYYYAGATHEGNRLNLPYVVVWEAMREAKRRGCRLWDFGGIYDARWPNKDWLGFSRFKKNFGGREIVYPGSYVKWRWPF